MPKWTAGLPLPGMGGALALSVLAHALALAWWLHARQIEDGAPSIGQKRGRLTVTLAPSPQVPQPEAPQIAQPKRPPSAQRVEPAPTPAPAPAPAPSPRMLTSHETAAARLPPAGPDSPPQDEPAQAASAPPASEAPSAPDTPPPANIPKPPAAPQPDAPGARFANLFAPIISRPLGRGRWQAPPSAPVPDEMGATMQREQAIQGTRQALAQRVEALKPSLNQVPLLGRCDIRISLEQQAAQLDCTQAADLQRLSPLFGAIVALQAKGSPLRADSCLQAEQRDLQWQPCPAHADAPPSASVASGP